MSRASRLSGFTTAISGDTDLNVGIVTATQINVDTSFTFTEINVTGVATANNLNVTGVSTLSNVVVGGATTELVVTGDARVTGILTVGTSSLTLNGETGVVSGITTINSVSLPSTGALSNRNLVINGAMNVAQRATSVTAITNSDYYTVDRFKTGVGSLGTWTVTQESDAPVGFSNSKKMTCTTADASPAAGGAVSINQRIEGQDLQHLNYGLSSAESLTLSFWVKSNKTGAASIDIQQQDNSNKLYSAGYTINAADTWEYKTITIPGDTAGVINDDNGIGIFIAWWLNSGSTYTGGSHGGWKTMDNSSRNANNLGVGGAVSDYFQLTGVQLEVGTQATPFEHRSYGDELVRCQRYYQHFASGGAGTATNANQTASAQCGITFTHEMRDTPDITLGPFINNTNCNGVKSASTIRKYGCLIQAQSSASGRQYW